MDTDADYIPRLNALRDDLLQRFIDEDGIARHAWCRRRKHEEPSRGNDCCSKRIVTGINEMYAHWSLTFPGTSPVVSESFSQENEIVADISLCFLAGNEASAGHSNNHTRRP